MRRRVGLFFAGVLLLAYLNANAQEGERRFKILTQEEMTPAQRTLAQSIRSGPRASVAGSAANSNNGTLGSPFNVFLRSPELGEHLQQVGTYIRFKSTLGAKLNEFAILITARQWNAQYEWFAHHRLALQAGLDPAIAQAVSVGKRPDNMPADEAIIYNFCQELHTLKRVSDATYQAAVQRFGEQGVMDLIEIGRAHV